jgi:hypothetical protein
MKQYNSFKLFYYDSDPDDPLVRKRIMDYITLQNENTKQEYR